MKKNIILFVIFLIIFVGIGIFLITPLCPEFNVVFGGGPYTEGWEYELKQWYLKQFCSDVPLVS